MDWTAKIEIDPDVLQRIVAILFALADLADRASGRSWPVRALVLSILHRAEDAAHAFVTGSADGATFTLPPPACGMPGLTMPRRDGPAEATRLALSLRLLALAVQALLAQARRFSRSRRGWGAFAASTQATVRREAHAPCLSQATRAAALPDLALEDRPDTS